MMDARYLRDEDLVRMCSPAFKSPPRQLPAMATDIRELAAKCAAKALLELSRINQSNRRRQMAKQRAGN
jgi:hypothetical protein